MAIDYSLLLTLKSMFRDGKYGREHNKHDFDADYNNFVLMQDKLAILANYELARGGIDNLLSYLDDNVVGSAIKDACNDKRYLSKAIENAYLVEDLKAKLDGNKSFDDVARAVYENFGKYVGNTVKSRLRSVLDYSFHEELCQAGSRVYFNRSLSGGNLEHLHDFVNYLIDNLRQTLINNRQMMMILISDGEINGPY